MSTDYGLKCTTCQKSCVCENLRDYALADVLRAIKPLADLRRAMKTVQQFGALDVELGAYWCPIGFEDLLDFIVEHENHSLVIVDEYDRTSQR